MNINAVNTSENKSKNASYLKAMAIGGVSGYILKHILPITPQERDERFESFLQDLKKQTRETKLKEIEAIRNSQSRTIVEDTFISLIDKKELKMSKIKQIKEPLASGIINIITQINDKGRATKEASREVFKTVTKHIRPTQTFFGIGAGIAVATAFVYNTLGRFSEK